jgi:uncharacterized membrane protein
MRRDLVLVVTLACMAFVAALLSPPVWLRAPLLVPLVLALPGYALAANLFPPRTVSPAERGVYTVGLSIAVAVAGGVLIQLVIGLDRYVWVVFLAAVTIAASLRGLRGEDGRRAALPLAGMPRSLPVAVVVFLAAAVIAAVAIASAGTGLRDAQAKVRFTDFWMLPGDEGAAAETVTVGLRSHEGRPTRYRLVLSRGGLRLAGEVLRLHAGEQMERTFAVTEAREAPRDLPVVATLRRDGLPYRSLDLRLSR